MRQKTKVNQFFLMNPEKIGKQIIKRLLMEEEMTKVSIYPGAF